MSSNKQKGRPVARGGPKVIGSTTSIVPHRDDRHDRRGGGA
jgi:hypothetical protein